MAPAGPPLAPPLHTGKKILRVLEKHALSPKAYTYDLCYEGHTTCMITTEPFVHFEYELSVFSFSDRLE
jgi:hypothetical protein